MTKKNNSLVTLLDTHRIYDILKKYLKLYTNKKYVLSVLLKTTIDGQSKKNRNLFIASKIELISITNVNEISYDTKNAIQELIRYNLHSNEFSLCEMFLLYSLQHYNNYYDSVYKSCNL